MSLDVSFHNALAVVFSALERIIPWLRIIASITLVVVGVGTCKRVFKTPLRSIPGPWFARFSRLWLLRAYAGRSFHKTNLDLHRKYGTIFILTESTHIEQAVYLRTY